MALRPGEDHGLPDTAFDEYGRLAYRLDPNGRVMWDCPLAAEGYLPSPETVARRLGIRQREAVRIAKREGVCTVSRSYRADGRLRPEVGYRLLEMDVFDWACGDGPMDMPMVSATGRSPFKLSPFGEAVAEILGESDAT